MNTGKENNNRVVNAETEDFQYEEMEYFRNLLKNDFILYCDIPEKFRKYIMPTEKSPLKKGYDVIHNKFFVEGISFSEIYWANEEKIVLFDDFSSYFKFLQGGIYENACYYMYNFTDSEIKEHKIETERLNFKSFIDYDIDEFTFNFTKQELAQYKTAERRKVYLNKWLDRFYCCNNYEELKKTIIDLRKSKFCDINIKFFLYNFIFYDRDKAFDIIMEYINNNYTRDLEYGLCLIYDPQRVFSAYNKLDYCSSQKQAERYCEDLKCFIDDFEKKAPKGSKDHLGKWSGYYFDEKTHYYVFEYSIKYKKLSMWIEAFRYFETFDDLVDFLDYDISYCDLSKAIIPNIDFSKVKIGNNTVLPIQYTKNYSYILTKKYDRKKQTFFVEQKWINEDGQTIKEYQHTFNHFFDFAHYLKNDLSNADLLFCNGFENIIDFSAFNLSNAKLKSSLLDKLGVKYELISNNVVESFPIIKNNEIETVNILTQERERANEDIFVCQTIHYISDIHLSCRIQKENCKNIYDVIYTIQKIIDNLLNCHFFGKDIILIAGDTVSDFATFELFLKLLRETIDENKIKVAVIFTLGNHELWNFNGLSFDEIVEKYKKVIEDNKMYLLEKNIIFKDDENNIGEITTEELNNISREDILNRLLKARVILFGGLGFSGKNEKFNAQQGIYRGVLNRQQEIEESKKFENLYEKVCSILFDRQVIILTHMPQKDWCSKNEQQKGFVYVSGHTHRNYFYDDGYYRIYADNQIGYYQDSCQLKHFYLDCDYDVFINYKDGIYEITREEYLDFNHGKNIKLEFKRDFYKLYMLKKNGYYMFILQYPSGSMSILNGGAVKRLPDKDVSYFYENMDKVIFYIESEMDGYSKYQKQISNDIMSIGGSGKIHGAIVDIDWFNHIYVGPDLSLTPYWASDVIYKVVFENVGDLLQSKLPYMYDEFLKRIEGNTENALVLNKSNVEKNTTLYLETDIYNASREIKKMQKLQSNILSIWIEPKLKKLNKE